MKRCLAVRPFLLSLALICASSATPVFAQTIRTVDSAIAPENSASAARFAQIAVVGVDASARVALDAATVPVALLDPAAARIVGPYRMGFRRAVTAFADDAATRAKLSWQSLTNGGRVGALSVVSPGALGMRAAVRVNALPDAASVRVRAPTDTYAFVFTGAEIRAVLAANVAAGVSGDAAKTWWTPATWGEEIVVEILLPAGTAADAVAVAVPAISHLYKAPRDAASAACAVAPACKAEADEASRATTRALVTWQNGDSVYCSATLLNDTDTASAIPYVLTASDCVPDQAAASTVQTYWFERATTCGGTTLDSRRQTVPGGAALLYRDAGTATAFLRLNAAPPAGAVFAGWQASTLPNARAVASVLQPADAPQSAVYGTVNRYVDWNETSLWTESAADAPYVEVHWNVGNLEAGAAGAGLFDGATHRFVGQAAAGNASTDAACTGGWSYYGNFAKAFDAGLNRWLAPSSASAESVAAASTAPLDAALTTTASGTQSTAASVSATAGALVGMATGSGAYTATITDYRNDAEEYGTAGVISWNDSMQIGGYWSTSLTAPYKQISAFRFPGVQLPDNARVTDAYLEFRFHSDSQTTRVSNMTIRTELGNPAQYTTTARSISQRTYGASTVAWQQHGFSTSGQYVRTPNLASLILEQRLYGWTNGGTLAFLIDGDNFIGSVYQGGTAYPPKLVVKWEYGDWTEGVVDKSAAALARVFINEVAAVGANDGTGWVELYNAGDKPVALDASVRLYQDADKATYHDFGGLLIPAHAYRIVYFDGATAQGPDHAGFTLKSAATLTLVQRAGQSETTLGTFAYGAHLAGQSFGRVPDGAANGVVFFTPSQGQANTASQQVGTYTATITDYRNDAEEYGTAGAISWGDSMQIGGYWSTSLTLPYRQISGFRFPNVKLPANARVTNAYLEFTTLTPVANRVSNMEVRTELGDAAQYAVVAYNLSKRTYSEIAVPWTQASFTAARQVVRSPNLADLILEQRLNGWEDGGTLAFLISGDNYIGAVYEGGTAYPPKLVIEYEHGDWTDGALLKGAAVRNVFINELSAKGTADNEDTWVEFYNANDKAVLLDANIRIYQNSNKKNYHDFAGLLIPARGYRVVTFDEKPEKGVTHGAFELKSDATLLLVNHAAGEVDIDSFTYPKQIYGQSYGRTTDGAATGTLFVEPSYGKANAKGQILYGLTFSRERGLYDTGFNLTLTPSKSGLSVRYTTDGTAPGKDKGTLLSGGSIPIGETGIVRAIAYDAAGHSGVLSHTYVLRDNFAREKVVGVRWLYKARIITEQQYAQALGELPIISIAGDRAEVQRLEYDPDSFEFIAKHLGEENFTSPAGVKKFGQVSSLQFNAGIAVRFKKAYGAGKAEYQFFKPVAGDVFAQPSKYPKLELHEGQDGPQADIYNLGYNRFDDKVTNTLAKQMGELALADRYVHYFYNGKYMGVKTMREDYGTQLFETYFGIDNDDNTKVSFQDAYFVPGIVEDGDGDPAIMKEVLATARAKDFQKFKKYVDVASLINTQIMFMFIDTECEWNAVISNKVLQDSGKMRFNVNDTDGAFFNNGRTGTGAYALAGGCGTYRYKWALARARRGAGEMFGAFSGDSTVATAGNLEFKTLVKDLVLKQIGPNSGDLRGAAGAPLSADNVSSLITANIAELTDVYRLDAAFMAARATIYNDWLANNAKVLSQIDDRVSFNLQQWAKYGMAHTLAAVRATASNGGFVLTNPNAGATVYVTTDGSDPMGADGGVSSAASVYNGGVLPVGATVRPYQPGNWGPKTVAK
ncbi:MAG: chitobiase/beta-hexosaminidase C-terminal domain-containing protein [Azoarcus sp.]|jgi:hypothetical protein|nr:chitobiase/beta-hexosaminidase C-terminal domain-containing protein [Azoarcus sp.]